MDDQHNNINAEDPVNMNGRDDSATNVEETQVLSKLFALDQQPDPSLRFVAQLGQSLMPSAGKMTLLSTTTSFEDPTLDPQPVTGAIGGGKRRRPIMSFGSAAVLMVIVVLVGYAVTLWAVDNSNNPPAYMAFDSTFEASSTAVADACYVEPRDLASIVVMLNWALYGVPDNTEFETPPATADVRTIGALTDGEPASEQTVERISAVFEQYVACWSIGDELRMYALFSDDGVVKTLAPNGVANFYRIAVLSRPPHPDIVSFQAWKPDRVEMLADGRAVLYIVDAFGEAPGTPESFVIFSEIDGHWFIEETHLAQG